MNGLDLKTWKLWDWIGAAVLFVAAIIPALNTALKDAPAVTSYMPGLLDSSFWTFGPLALLVLFAIIAAIRSWTQHSPEGKAAFSPTEMESIRYSGRARFRLVPQYFSVSLHGPLPYVEARFFAINFLPRRIYMTQGKLSMQIESAAPLELIPLAYDDLPIEPFEATLVVFRRNLSDAEKLNLPWRDGRNSASYELVTKAQDGAETLSFGPVSSMAIDGWVYVPPKPV